ncbi:MAG: hypothetical protein ACOX6W_00055 [Lentisphaeria bacterium]|jgi:hypothetical protein
MTCQASFDMFFRTVLRSILILPFMLICTALGDEQAMSQKDMEKLDGMFQGYYLNPQPDIVAEMIRLGDGMAKAIGDDGMVGVEQPFIGFFSEIFRANPDRLQEWDKAINSLSSKKFKDFLSGALFIADTPQARKILQEDAKKTAYLKKRYGNVEQPPKILDRKALSPADLDMCWGAFFGSGNRDYVKKVMKCALTIEGDGVIDLSAYAARWSVIANADRHPIVAEVMNSLLKEASDAEFRLFTEVMPGELREQLLEDDVRKRVEELKVPLPDAAGRKRTSTTQHEPKPLPPKGAAVDYSMSKSFKKLYDEAKYTHKEYHDGNGKVVIGKLKVEGQDDIEGVASKAVFAENGIFVAPLYAGRTLRFVKHGYEPLDVELPKYSDDSIPGIDLDLGEQILRRLPDAKTVDIQFDLELPPDVPQAQVELWTGDLPSTFNDDGYDGRAPIHAFATKALSAGGNVAFSGLTPMNYQLRITAPECIYFSKAFDTAKDKELGTIKLQKTRLATFQIAKFVQSSSWKEMKVPVDGKTELTFADKPDQFGQYDGFRLTYKDETHLGAFFIHWPNFFDDYGEMTQEKFLELEKMNNLPTPRTTKGETILEVGHLYRFRCKSRKTDLLLQFTKME